MRAYLQAAPRDTYIISTSPDMYAINETPVGVVVGKSIGSISDDIAGESDGEFVAVTAVKAGSLGALWRRRRYSSAACGLQSTSLCERGGSQKPGNEYAKAGREKILPHKPTINRI